MHFSHYLMLRQPASLLSWRLNTHSKNSILPLKTYQWNWVTCFMWRIFSLCSIHMGTLLLYKSWKINASAVFFDRKSFGLDFRKKGKDNGLLQSNPHAIEERYDAFSDNSFPFGSLSRNYTSSRSCSVMAVSAKGSFACNREIKDESEVSMTTTISQESDFNRVDHIVWVLHESSRNFSLAVESLRLAGSGPELAMAWLGKDVHEWHRRIAYQVYEYTYKSISKIYMSYPPQSLKVVEPIHFSLFVSTS